MLMPLEKVFLFLEIIWTLKNKLKHHCLLE